jgi:DNA repair protein RecN (Recombination protein N)
MLSELHIEDLGIIDRLDLVLGNGLTVLTGETGAGKTMLVEAISLLVGGRADAGVFAPEQLRLVLKVVLSLTMKRSFCVE